MSENSANSVNSVNSENFEKNNFVNLFRSTAPYINTLRGKIFVIALSSKAVASEYLKSIIYDINLLVSLGVKIVIIHGARFQIEDILRSKNLPEATYHQGYRITDAQTLDCVLEAIGAIYLEISALLSQGLPNTPMANAKNRVISGNFIVGRPLGVLDGVDLKYTGKVRKVDGDGILSQLNLGNIVLINNEGPSPTGEIFNLQMTEVAQEVAIAIKADKLIFLTESKGLYNLQNQFINEITTEEIKANFLNTKNLTNFNTNFNTNFETNFETNAENQTNKQNQNYIIQRLLPIAVNVCEKNINSRVHLISFYENGALLQELFTQDGIGTVITKQALENIREAKADDIAALLNIIEPLEKEGVLVHRPRELLEREIEHFSIMLYDNIIVGCAALYVQEKDAINDDNNDYVASAELACLAVRSDQRKWGYGERLVKRIENRAKALGIKRLFVLTTQTEHWFIEHGFMLGEVSQLPFHKRKLYNLQRKSKVLFKYL